MIQIETKEATRRLKKLQNDLSERQVKKAIVRALNYSVRKVNTRTKREIRKYYNIPAYNIDKLTQPRMASARTLTAAIAAEKSTLSMSAFNPTAIQQDTKSGIRYEMKRTGGRKGGVTGKFVTKIGARKGIYIKIIKGHTEHMPGAFMGFWNKKTSLGESRISGGAIFARGEYTGSGFSWAKGKHGISKLKSKSIYWSILNKQVGPNLISDGMVDYEREFVRQITGAIQHGR